MDAFPASTPSHSPASSPASSSLPAQMDPDLDLSLFPSRLRFLTFPKSALTQYTHALLKLIIFDTGKEGKEGRGRFFSYTETMNELSFVVDEPSYYSLIQSFPTTSATSSPSLSSSDTVFSNSHSSPYSVSTDTWRAIQAIEGPSYSSLSEPSAASSLVAVLSAILAENNISIFYLSTYQTDIVLVKERELERVKRILEDRLRITIMYQGEDEEDRDTESTREEENKLDHAQSIHDSGKEARSERESQEGQENGEPLPLTSSSLSTSPSSSESIQSSPVVDESSSSSSSSSPVSIELSLSSLRLHLLSLPTREIQSCTRALIEAIFYSSSSSSSPSPHFFSYTDIDDSISLIVDDLSLSLFSSIDSRLHSSDQWRLFFVTGQYGFEETGIVSNISKPLVQSNIPPFYISSYYTDYFLLEEERAEEGKDILKQLFNVKDM